MLNHHIKIQQHTLLLFCFPLNLTKSNYLSKAKAILHLQFMVGLYIYIIHEKDQVFYKIYQFHHLI